MRVNHRWQNARIADGGEPQEVEEAAKNVMPRRARYGEEYNRTSSRRNAVNKRCCR